MSSDIIKFIHNNNIMEINDVDPNETLLNYIRYKLKKTGQARLCQKSRHGLP